MDNGVTLIQTETYFNDLVKLETESNTGFNVQYMTKKTLYEMIDHMFVTKCVINNINENENPILSKYDNVERKELEIYYGEYYDVIFIKRDNMKWICIRIDGTCHKIIKKKLDNIFTI